MGEETNIEWVGPEGKTWNPWIGCQHKHVGCDRCYAEAFGKRIGVKWGPAGTRRRTADANWRKPLTWNREASCNCGAAGCGPGECAWCSSGCLRPRVFPSLCDVFEQDAAPGQVVDKDGKPLFLENGRYTHSPKEWKQPATMADLRRDFAALRQATPNLVWILATKRPENIRDMMPDGYEENVWLLYSASDQATLEAGLLHLLACRDLVPVRGLSLEPLLGPIYLRPEWLTLLDWVIVGSESGPGARPMHEDWVRGIRDQCEAAGVPLFYKQRLEHGKKIAMPELDGRIWAEVPRC